MSHKGTIIVQFADPTGDKTRTIIYDGVDFNTVSLQTLDTGKFYATLGNCDQQNTVRTDISFYQRVSGYKTHTRLFTSEADASAYPDLDVLLPVLTDDEVYQKAKAYIELYENRLKRISDTYSDETLITFLESRGYKIEKTGEDKDTDVEED